MVLRTQQHRGGAMGKVRSDARISRSVGGDRSAILPPYTILNGKKKGDPTQAQQRSMKRREEEKVCAIKEHIYYYGLSISAREKQSEL